MADRAEEVFDFFNIPPEDRKAIRAEARRLAHEAALQRSVEAIVNGTDDEFGPRPGFLTVWGGHVPTPKPGPTG